jgi:hypothetical protein
LYTVLAGGHIYIYIYLMRVHWRTTWSGCNHSQKLMPLLRTRFGAPPRRLRPFLGTAPLCHKGPTRRLRPFLGTAPLCHKGPTRRLRPFLGTAPISHASFLGACATPAGRLAAGPPPAAAARCCCPKPDGLTCSSLTPRSEAPLAAMLHSTEHAQHLPGDLQLDLLPLQPLGAVVQSLMDPHAPH